MNTLNFRKNTINAIALRDIAMELQKDNSNKEYLKDQTTVWAFDDEFNYGITYAAYLEEILEANAKEYLPYEEDFAITFESHDKCDDDCINCTLPECICPF